MDSRLELVLPARQRGSHAGYKRNRCLRQALRHEIRLGDGKEDSFTVVSTAS